MTINKRHPKYAEYFEKCIDLSEQEDAEIEQFEKSQRKNAKSFDSPLALIHKKYAQKIKELQKEYSFLFEEDKD